MTRAWLNLGLIKSRKNSRPVASGVQKFVDQKDADWRFYCAVEYSTLTILQKLALFSGQMNKTFTPSTKLSPQPDWSENFFSSITIERSSNFTKAHLKRKTFFITEKCRLKKGFSSANKQTHREQFFLIFTRFGFIQKIFFSLKQNKTQWGVRRMKKIV